MTREEFYAEYQPPAAFRGSRSETRRAIEEYHEKKKAKKDNEL